MGVVTSDHQDHSPRPTAARQPSNKRSQQQPKARPKPKPVAQNAKVGLAVEDLHAPSPQELSTDVPFYLPVPLQQPEILQSRKTTFAFCGPAQSDAGPQISLGRLRAIFLSSLILTCVFFFKPCVGMPRQERYGMLGSGLSAWGANFPSTTRVHQSPLCQETMPTHRSISWVEEPLPSLSQLTSTAGTQDLDEQEVDDQKVMNTEGKNPTARMVWPVLAATPLRQLSPRLRLYLALSLTTGVGRTQLLTAYRLKKLCRRLQLYLMVLPASQLLARHLRLFNTLLLHFTSVIHRPIPYNCSVSTQQGDCGRHEQRCACCYAAPFLPKWCREEDLVSLPSTELPSSNLQPAGATRAD